MNIYKSYQLILRYPYQGWRQGRAGGGRQGAKYLGPGLVSEHKIVVKRLVMGATVKMVGGP